MKLFRWQKGRQLTNNYLKFSLWYFRILNYSFDAYILKYEPFTDLHPYKDKVENAEHHRLNITLKGFSRFCILDRKSVYGKATRWRITHQKINCFRPDLYTHCVQIGDRTCYKLSFGFVKFLK